MTADAPMTVAAVVRAMRRAGAAGEPVPAIEAAAWARVCMDQLYGLQKPVRYECRPKHSVEPWVAAEVEDIIHARRRNLEVRALYLHPLVQKQQHRWPPGSDGQGHCLDCDEAEWLAGPECRPHAPLRDQRSDMPFLITWLIEPLEKLQHLTMYMSPPDRPKWRKETAYLIARIKDLAKGTSHARAETNPPQ